MNISYTVCRLRFDCDVQLNRQKINSVFSHHIGHGCQCRWIAWFTIFDCRCDYVISLICRVLTHTHTCLICSYRFLQSCQKTHSNWRRIRMTFVLNFKIANTRVCQSKSFRTNFVVSKNRVRISSSHHFDLADENLLGRNDWRKPHECVYGSTGQSRNSFADRIVRIDSGQVIANSMTNRRSTLQTSEWKLFFPFIRLVAKRSLIAPFSVWPFLPSSNGKMSEKSKRWKACNGLWWAFAAAKHDNDSKSFASVSLSNSPHLKLCHYTLFINFNNIIDY